MSIKAFSFDFTNPHLPINQTSQLHSLPTYSLSLSTMTDIPTLYVLNKNYSSWSLRVWLVLSALGVNFETVILTVGTKELPDVDHPDFPALMACAGPTSKVNNPTKSISLAHLYHPALNVPC